MFYFLLVIHLIISVALILSVIFQSSKGGGLTGMVGGAANNMMGAQGASEFFKKITKILGFAFFASSLLFALTVKNMESKTSVGSAVEKLKEKKAQQPIEEPIKKSNILDKKEEAKPTKETAEKTVKETTTEPAKEVNTNESK